MAYKALVAPVRVRPHPNSDNGLKILNINGYQVITAADVKDGDLMVFFEAGGVLSPDFLRVNNEYRPKYGMNENQQEFLKGNPLDFPLTRASAQPGGFFEDSGRVRTIRMRGEKSEGYCVKPQMLAYTGYDVTSFFAGQTFDELAGHKVCWKYVSPATRAAMAKAQKQGQRSWGLEMFHKHFDTENLRHGINSIPDGARVVITEKLHGTSGRTGLVLADPVPSRLASWVNWMAEAIGLSYRYVEPQVWEVVSGTRQVVRYIGDRPAVRPDLEGGEDEYVRREVHNQLGPCLRKGETIYYEIVGHYETGQPIFKHGIPDDDVGSKIWKRFKNILPDHWGRNFHYTYGTMGNNYGLYVYRITQTNLDGQSVDLGWEQIQTRCQSIGLQTVPEQLTGRVYWAVDADGNKNLHLVTDFDRQEFADGNTRGGPGAPLLNDVLEELGHRACSLDPRHITEGSCIRVEHQDLQKTFKYRALPFVILRESPRTVTSTWMPRKSASTGRRRRRRSYFGRPWVSSRKSQI